MPREFRDHPNNPANQPFNVTPRYKQQANTKKGKTVAVESVTKKGKKK